MPKYKENAKAISARVNAQVAPLLSHKPKQNPTYITTIPQPTRNNTLTPKIHNITRRKITVNKS
jgi:hypothetical protein